MSAELLEQAVKSANIPPAAAWILAHSEPFSVSVVLPADPAGWPKLALQLLKLNRQRPDLVSVRETRFTDDPGEARVFLHGPASAYRVGPPELETLGVEALMTEFTLANGGAVALTRLFAHAAFHSSVLENLHIITRYMLKTSDVDLLHHIFLTGLTAGYGLGFNRAALFIHDPLVGCLSGEKAIGSLTLAEARRIWEIIEVQDDDIEDFIRRYMAGDHYVDSSLLGAFGDSIVKLTGLPEDDEFRRAIAAREPLRCTGPAVNPALARLGPGSEFLLAPVIAHERLWGVVFCDNAFNARPLDADVLSLTGLFVNQVALIQENFAMQETLRAEARLDHLTGVANRSEMEKLLDYLFSIDKPDLRFWLLLMDIDDFKGINDTKGHAFGDHVLVEYSKILKSVVRAGDFVARYGGDEFLIVIRDAARDKVVEIADRLRGRIRAQLDETVSIGVACYPADSRSRVELFERADRCLYEAKRQGKNRVVFSGDFEAPTL